MYYFVNKVKHCQVCTCFIWFYCFLPIYADFLQWNLNMSVFITVFILVFMTNEKWNSINMFHGKISDFVSFLLFGFILVTKLRFWKSRKYFWSKKWCHIWLCPVKQCLIWFKPGCLTTILAIGWDVQILNFIEIV